jgi:hypothetical protein
VAGRSRQILGGANQITEKGHKTFSDVGGAAALCSINKECAALKFLLPHPAIFSTIKRIILNHHQKAHASDATPPLALWLSVSLPHRAVNFARLFDVGNSRGGKLRINTSQPPRERVYHAINAARQTAFVRTNRPSPARSKVN